MANGVTHWQDGDLTFRIEDFDCGHKRAMAVEFVHEGVVRRNAVKMPAESWDRDAAEEALRAWVKDIREPFDFTEAFREAALRHG